MMKPQLFAPRTKADVKNLPKGKLKIKNMRAPNKPVGAFWTSTWDGTGSRWTDWVSGSMPDWKQNKGILMEVRSNAKVYIISNRKDYEELYKKYPAKTEHSMFNPLDWEAISKDYDGVWVKNPYAHDDLYGWDVESTSWFNMKVLKPVKVVDVK